MVGYSDDHSGDTYWMFDPMTDKVQNTHDMHWVEWK